MGAFPADADVETKINALHDCLEGHRRATEIEFAKAQAQRESAFNRIDELGVKLDKLSKLRTSDAKAAKIWTLFTKKYMAKTNASLSAITAQVGATGNRKTMAGLSQRVAGVWLGIIVAAAAAGPTLVRESIALAHAATVFIGAIAHMR